MKIVIKFVLALFVLSATQNLEAQLFKKLKDKIIKKVSPKEDIENAQTENPTFGSTVIKHGNTYGTVHIPEVSKVKVEKTNTTYNFRGSWWSHDADIHDGFYLVIKTPDDLRQDIQHEKSNTKRTYKIPEEATLKLSYDPTLPYYSKSESNYKQAVTDSYQTYDVSKGEVTIDVLTAQAIQISFSGRVSLKKVERSEVNSEDFSETYFESSITGAIDGSTPQFINNTTIKKPENTNQNSGGYVMSEVTGTTSKPSVYQFTFETVVKVTSTEDNETYTMSYLLNPNESYMAIKANMSDYSDEEMEGESIIVMDNGNAHVFVETGGMKIQMSQNTMGGQQMSNPSDQMADYDYSKITKTGNTKTVLGATCYEYTMSDKDVKMFLWVAPEVNLPNWFVQNDDLIQGHIMEYTITSKDGNMTSETIAINDNIKKTVNPEDYKKMF